MRAAPVRKGAIWRFSAPPSRFEVRRAICASIAGTMGCYELDATGPVASCDGVTKDTLVGCGFGLVRPPRIHYFPWPARGKRGVARRFVALTSHALEFRLRKGEFTCPQTVLPPEKPQPDVQKRIRYGYRPDRYLKINEP